MCMMKICVTICLLIALASQCAAQKATPSCKPGTFTTGKNCTECPPGTFQNKFGQPFCKPCPRGTYGTVRGGVGVDVCQPCRAGTFNNLKKSASEAACKRCPKGQNSPPGAATCISCPKGQIIVYRRFPEVEIPDFKNQVVDFNDGHRVAYSLWPTCRPCKENFFNPTVSSFRCLPCKDNEISGKGASRCKKCKAGACPEPFGTFQYNDGTFRGCKPCRAGFHGNSREGATRCVPCPRGSARTTDTSTIGCLRCDPGHNANVTGASICIPDDTPCPSNFFRNFRGACERCSTLERYKKKMKKCEACGENEESLGSLATKCKRCPKGSFIGPDASLFLTRSSYLGTRCQCIKGWGREKHGKCKPCAPGSASEFGFCEKCKAGTFAPRSGMIKCSKCPPKTVQPLEGQSKCFTCPKGLVSHPLRGCVNPKTNCEPGFKRVVDEFDGLLVHCNPPKCPPGTFMTNFEDQFLTLYKNRFTCKACGTDKRFSPVEKLCYNCGENEVSDGGTSTKCRKCPIPGQFNFEGSCVCESIFESVELVKGVCRVCKPGYTSKFSEFCVPCPAGMHDDGHGHCATCFGAVYDGDTLSTYSGPGATKCLPCPKGTVSFHAGEVGSANCVRPGSLAGK